MAPGPVWAAWGGGQRQRWADAPEFSLCRATGPSPGCALHYVPRECPGPAGVRPGDPGGRGCRGQPHRQHTTTPTQRGTLVVVFSAEAPTPGWHSLFPSLCNAPWQTTEEQSHPDTARTARLLPAIRRVPSWGAPAPLAPTAGGCSAAHWSEGAPVSTPAAPTPQWGAALLLPCPHRAPGTGAALPGSCSALGVEALRHLLRVGRGLVPHCCSPAT